MRKLKELIPIHHKCIEQKLLGRTKEEGAENLGISVQYYRQILIDPLVIEELGRRKELYLRTSEIALMYITQDAVSVLEKAVLNEDNVTKQQLQAAMYVIDKNLGKALENIKVTTEYCVTIEKKKEELLKLYNDASGIHQNHLLLEAEIIQEKEETEEDGDVDES